MVPRRRMQGPVGCLADTKKGRPGARTGAKGGKCNPRIDGMTCFETKGVVVVSGKPKCSHVALAEQHFRRITTAVQKMGPPNDTSRESLGMLNVRGLALCLAQ